MINLRYTDDDGTINANLLPDNFEKYQKSYGESVEMIPRFGIIVDNYGYESGGVFNYFLMTWEFADKGQVDVLNQLLRKNPKTLSPMILTWKDGSKHKVVFAPIGEDKCLFAESTIDIKTNEKFYSGQCALIEITKEN